MTLEYYVFLLALICFGETFHEKLSAKKKKIWT